MRPGHEWQASSAPGSPDCRGAGVGGLGALRHARRAVGGRQPLADAGSRRCRTEAFPGAHRVAGGLTIQMRQRHPGPPRLLDRGRSRRIHRHPARNPARAGRILEWPPPGPDRLDQAQVPGRRDTVFGLFGRGDAGRDRSARRLERDLPLGLPGSFPNPLSESTFRPGPESMLRRSGRPHRHGARANLRGRRRHGKTTGKTGPRFVSADPDPVRTRRPPFFQAPKLFSTMPPAR